MIGVDPLGPSRTAVIQDRVAAGVSTPMANALLLCGDSHGDV